MDNARFCFLNHRLRGNATLVGARFARRQAAAPGRGLACPHHPEPGSRAARELLQRAALLCPVGEAGRCSLQRLCATGTACDYASAASGVSTRAALFLPLFPPSSAPRVLYGCDLRRVCSRYGAVPRHPFTETQLCDTPFSTHVARAAAGTPHELYRDLLLAACRVCHGPRGSRWHPVLVIPLTQLLAPRLSAVATVTDGICDNRVATSRRSFLLFDYFWLVSEINMR